jgi:antitoxin component of MazEF toxin-antitoxin module
MSVDLNPANQTVTANRTLRQSGSSVVLTFPPQVLQSLELAAGDEVEIEGDWSTGEITITSAE